MGFESFYRTDIQKKLAKRTKKQMSKKDGRTFDELLSALEIAEDKIIELENKIKTSKKHSVYADTYSDGFFNISSGTTYGK